MANRATPSSPPVARPRPHAMLLAGLLVCTLALPTMPAYWPNNPAQSHRATAERALHDYAAVAAWELVAGVNEELQSSAGGALAPLTRARATSPYEPLASPAALVSSADNVLRCSTPQDSARFYCRIDIRDGSLVTAGAAVSPVMREWLSDSILAHGRNVYQPGWGFAVVLGGPRGETPSAIVYGLKYAEHSAPIAAFGFRTCPDAIGQSMIRDVIARHPLLPASVSGGAPNDSIVALSVFDRTGRVVYQSPGLQPSPYSGSAPLEQVGSFLVNAS